MTIPLKKTFLVLLLGGVSLVTLEAGCLWWQYRRAIVIIKNDSGQAVSDVRVEMREGVQVLGTLGPGDHRRLRVYPQGESDFKVSFRTPEQRLVSAPGSYIESTGGYRVVARIGPAPDWHVTAQTSFARGCVLVPLLSRFFRRSK